MILRVLIARHDRQFKVVFRVYDISVFGGFGSDVDQGAAQGLELVSEAKQSVALTLDHRNLQWHLHSSMSKRRMESLDPVKIIDI